MEVVHVIPAPTTGSRAWLSLTRRAKLPSRTSLAWLCIEGTVAVVAGIAAGSIALVREIVYGITATGKRRALYPADFKPDWIVHDVPILAAS